MNEGERPTASSTGAHAWAASASPRGRADGSPVPHAGGIWVSYSGSVARFKCTLASPRGFEISAVLQRGRPARGVQLEDYDRPLTNRSLQPTKPLCTIPLPESPSSTYPCGSASARATECPHLGAQWRPAMSSCVRRSTSANERVRQGQAALARLQPIRGGDTGGTDGARGAGRHTAFGQRRQPCANAVFGAAGRLC